MFYYVGQNCLPSDISNDFLSCGIFILPFRNLENEYFCTDGVESPLSVTWPSRSNKSVLHTQANSSLSQGVQRRDVWAFTLGYFRKG